MPDTTADTIKILNDLIETLEDGRMGFATAADAVKDLRYRDLFRRNSQQRARFVFELQEQVQRLDGKAKDHGTAAGAAHRGWMNLRTAVTSKDERAVLAECERGEDHAVKVFREAIAKPLPDSVRAIVERQAGEVNAAHVSMRALRDAEKATGQK